jgi:threonine dehydrogenase-like Zn-dependent dehydrogenase
MVVDEVTLIGSRCGPLRPALDLLERGIISPVNLVERRYLLKDAPAAFEHAARPGVLKILVKVVE